MNNVQLEEIQEILDEACQSAKMELVQRLLYCEEEEIHTIRAEAGAIDVVRGRIRAKVMEVSDGE